MFFVGWVAFIATLAVALVATASLLPHGADGVAVVPPGYAWCLLGLPLIGALVALLVVRRFACPRVIVGSDGVRIVGSPRQVFIAYSDVEKMEHLPGTVRLHRKKGKAHDLGTLPDDDTVAVALARAIADAFRGYRGARPSIAALGRQGRSFSQWNEAIVRVAGGAGTFREPSFDREDLQAILGDGAAPPDQRIGAALALRALGPDQAAPRIRVAVSATANERLRVALDAIVNEEASEESLVLRACEER